MEAFTPSLDWGNELITSLVWVSKAWVISAACTLAVLAVLARYTTWGRRYWRVTGDYFKGRQSIPVWVWLGGLLASVMLGVRIDVLLSCQGNHLHSALETAFSGKGAVRDSGIQGFWMALVTLAVLATTHIVRTCLICYLMQRFIIRWRVWLTDRLTADWLDGDAYYRGRFIDDPIDNPDQCIQ